MPTPLKLLQVMVKSEFEDLHPSCFLSVTVQTTAAADDLFLHPGPQTNVHLFDHCLTCTHHLRVAPTIVAFVFMFGEHVGGATVWHHNSAAATAWRCHINARCLLHLVDSPVMNAGQSKALNPGPGWWKSVVNRIKWTLHEVTLYS